MINLIEFIGDGFIVNRAEKKTPFTITMEKKMNKKNELLSADSLNTNNLLGTFNIGLPSEVFANLHGNRPIKIKIEMNVNKLQ